MHVASPSERGPVKSLVAWFPVVKDGEAIHEVQYYVQNVEQIPITVIYSDATRDLALVRLASLPKGVHAFRLADKSAATGEQLHSLGGYPRGSRGLFIYTQGTSRATYQRSIATGGTIRVLETQMPLNQGNSGGPILNDQGEVVAVFEGLMIEPGVQLVNMCIDLSEVRAFLEAAEPLIDPQSVADWNRRGDLHYEAGRYELAFADYTSALERDPKNAEATSNRGWVYYQQGDAETALAEFNAALQLDPALVYGLWGRGTIWRDRHEKEKAVQDFTDAIRHAEETSQRGDLFNERGNTYYASEDYTNALADYDRAIETRPDQAWPHANRGDALARLGRYDEALESLGKAIELAPNTAEFWNLAGNVWFERERYDLAITMYTNAISRNEKEPMYYRNRGGATRLAGQPLEALADLQKAVELAPANADFWNELGVALRDAGRYDLALSAFTKSIELQPDDAVYLKNRGDAAQRQGAHQQVIDDLTRAIALQDSAELRVMRGNSYQALGDPKSAQKDYQKATELDDSYQLYDRRYLKVVNDTGQDLTVSLVYYTKTKSGTWQWFPAKPGEGNSVQYTFTPGESGILYHDDWKVNANRVRLWAESSDRIWPAYRDTDLILAPEGGYLTNEGDFATFLFNFN
jgi:tetratricopeptide (TPR) repeat protein